MSTLNQTMTLSEKLKLVETSYWNDGPKPLWDAEMKSVARNLIVDSHLLGWDAEGSVETLLNDLTIPNSDTSGSIAYLESYSSADRESATRTLAPYRMGAEFDTFYQRAWELYVEFADTLGEYLYGGKIERHWELMVAMYLGAQLSEEQMFELIEPFAKDDPYGSNWLKEASIRTNRKARKRKNKNCPDYHLEEGVEERELAVKVSQLTELLDWFSKNSESNMREILKPYGYM